MLNIAVLECELCGLPARSPVKSRHADAEQVFCCSGCRNVWSILVESGQQEPGQDLRASPLFKQAFAMGLIGTDSESVAQAATPANDTIQFERKGSTLDDQRQCVLRIEGMWCVSCAWLITESLRKQRGVVSAEVSFASDTARIVYKPARTGEDALKLTVQQLGYQAAPLGEADADDPHVKARRRELTRVGLCIAFAMNVMMLQFVLYAGLINGIEPIIRHWFPWLLFILSIPVFICASPLFVRAARAAARGVATMETLVCLGSSVALLYSVQQALMGSDHVYFDTADMLLALVMVGKFIESGVRVNAGDALSLLYGLMPRKAVVLQGSREVPVAVEKLSEGDMVIVRTGERIPADGFVTAGEGTVDESLVSGESLPVGRSAGQGVTGGTILSAGLLTIRVEKSIAQGALSRIIGLVEESLRKKTPPERTADQISRVFVPAVVLTAVTTGLVLHFGLHAGFDTTITRAVSVLVIACPCALGLATPMAISAGVAEAAQRGILISDGGAFDTIARLKKLILDKTGTVTEGRFEVRKVVSNDDNLDALAALENGSEHPIARAIVKHVQNGSLKATSQLQQFEQRPGRGILGVVDGEYVFAGNSTLVSDAHAVILDTHRTEADELAAEGLTVIYWGIVGDKVSGVMALGDRVKPTAPQAIAALVNQGITCELVSGDSEATTRAVACALGIQTWTAGATPESKAEWIRGQEHGRGTIGMVGDGVNDSPALALADVGFAMASGTDIAARTAQVTLLSGDLRRLPMIITLAKATTRIIRQNLVWAFLYNVICIPLAVLGYVTPLWAAAAMLLSSVTVLVNTQRLRRALPPEAH